MRDTEPREWFAWYPVTDWSTGKFVWLKTVWRRKERMDGISKYFGHEVWSWFCYSERPANNYWQDGEGAMSGGRK